MTFQVGRPKTGGRKVGGLNKLTIARRTVHALVEQLDAHQFDAVKEMTKLYPALPQELQVDILMRLFEYLFPKKKSNEITITQAQEVLKNDLESQGIKLDSKAIEALDVAYSLIQSEETEANTEPIP